VPLGGVGDLSVIDAAQAVAGKPEPLAAIAAHEGGGSAIVALATAERQGGRLSGLSISIKRYSEGRLAGAQGATFSIKPGESDADFMTRAVSGTAAAIESGANEAEAGDGPPASLTAIVPINGLGDWIAVRDRLAAVPAVHRVDLLSLSRQEARIEITYSGTADDLRTSLAEANLDLGGGAPTWQVRPAAAAGQLR